MVIMHGATLAQKYVNCDSQLDDQRLFRSNEAKPPFFKLRGLALQNHKKNIIHKRKLLILPLLYIVGKMR